MNNFKLYYSSLSLNDLITTNALHTFNHCLPRLVMLADIKIRWKKDDELNKVIAFCFEPY